MLQTHTYTLGMLYLLLCHYNNGFANAPQCYVICTLPVLLIRNTFCMSRISYMANDAVKISGKLITISETHNSLRVEIINRNEFPKC